jgi:hypothetical protein
MEMFTRFVFSESTDVDWRCLNNEPYIFHASFRGDFDQHLQILSYQYSVRSLFQVRPDGA